MVQNDRQRLIVTPTVGRGTFRMSSSKEAPSTTVVVLCDSNLVRVRHSLHYDRGGVSIRGITTNIKLV